MDAEVLIVGGGPAGSHLAYLLARRGRDCLLIDRAHFPRDKVCGGGLSLKAARLLEPLPPRLVRRTITGAVLTHRNRHRVHVDLGRPAGYTVTRRELDAWLWRRAERAGAATRAGVAYRGHRHGNGQVVVETDAGIFKCRLLVGADGAGSRVRAALVGNGRRMTRPGLEVLLPAEVSGLPADRALFDLGAVPGGYGWIFPKGDHLNAGVFAGTGPGVRRHHLRAFLHAYGLEETEERLGYPIPLDGLRGPVEGPGVWLLGDAAGLAEPMLGEGIYHALLSAEIAAEALAGGVPPPGRYTRALRHALGAELRAARRLGRWLFPCSALVVRHLARRPRFSLRFTALMTGEAGYRACLRTTLATLPLTLLSPPRLPCHGPLAGP